MTDAAGPTTRSRIPALVVVAVAAVLLVIPQLAAPLLPSESRGPVFPARVGSYSWWTSPLSPAAITAASVVYQNGVGVEFLDFPQAVVLAAEGDAYRRLTLAEQRSTPDDQGDPAQTLLSADGTFALVAGASGEGAVELLTFAGMDQRTLPVGDGVSAIPVSIDAAGRSALLLTSDASLSPYTDVSFRLHAGLARLDLETGDLRPYALGDVHAAAISPDGSRIVADTDRGLVLVGAASGEPTETGLLLSQAALDGDAWSPDGRQIAVLDGDVLRILDATRPGVEHTAAVAAVEYGSVIGWRDAETVLLHAMTADGSNESRFLWVDASTGAAEPFSAYAPDFTGAALAVPDVARHLVADWEVADRRPDRGPLSLVAALVAGLPFIVLAGLVALALTPRRGVPRRPGEPEPT